jgi:amino acid adenylation domain-containing protein
MTVEPLSAGRDRAPEGAAAGSAASAAAPPPEETSALEILAHLRSLDFSIWLDGDRLRWSAPKGVATPAMLARLAEFREPLRALLRGGGPGSALPPITPVPRGGPLPLSYSQLRLWFLVELAPDLPAYNQPEAVRIGGRLRVAELARSVEEVVRRHESLRTTFHARGGEPFQVIARRLRVPLPVVDLSALPPPARPAAGRRLARRGADRVFDLARGPLVRTLLLRFARDEHWFFLDFHHLATDRWSMGIFTDEMAALYEAFSAGRPSPLPAPRLHYADFACWQRRWLEGEALGPLRDYWRRHLAGAPPVLWLPLDRPRRPRRTAKAGYEPILLPPRLAAGIRELGQRAGATPFMVLLAAFKALLARTTAQTDLTVGSLIANRNRPEIEGVIGFFVNTLALRTRLEIGLPFADLLRRVQGVTLGAYAHQDLPFEKLLEELQPERSTSYSPLFQVMLVLQNTPAPPIELRGLAVRRLDLGLGVWGQVDVGLWLWPQGETFAGYADYAADLFDRSTIRRLLGQFQTLLAGVLAAPERPLADLPLLSPGQRWQVVGEWNDTAAAYGPQALVHRLIEAQAGRSPERVAVAFEDGCLSSAELGSRANRLGHRLRRLGVGPDVRVGVALPRSLELEVGLLGVLAAGGAYLPLDLSFPAERLAGMVAEAAPAVVLTPPGLAEQLPLGRGRALVVGGGDEEAGGGRAAPPAGDPLPDHLAYVIYTSGSTGKPKGAMNTHRGMVNRLLWMQRVYALGPEDRVLQKTPVSFDVSVWELFWPLLAGARLVIARPEGHKDPAYLRRLIVAEGITTLHFVPSMLEAFLEANGEVLCPALRRVIASGEALPRDLVGRFYSHLGGGGAARLHNLYGPTEAAVDVSFRPCPPAEGEGGVPIGRPIDNLGLYLLDARLRPVPPGVPAEVFIGGAGLARGYLERPALTAERFVPHPLAATPGARLYRTGDRCRWLADGEIEFLGRLDSQVKLRGLRIELGEIEARLVALPEVRQAVVEMRQDLAGGAALVAYVVAAEGAAPTAAAIRGALRARLPDYIVPAHVLILDALPLTANGKVDRRRLPAPEPVQGGRGAGFRAPTNPVEEILAEQFAEVLQADRVGIDDSFFDLGGHSLLVTRLVARIGEAFHLELPVRVVFGAPTVSELAVVVEEMVLEKIDQFSEEEVEALL